MNTNDRLTFFIYILAHACMKPSLSSVGELIELELYLLHLLEELLQLHLVE